ncbi:ComEA family DNA-binding protein [Saccharophagus degradans]|uniref:Competence protein ComEA helix-hairpin-helix region n=1 Tax=Saccharophagus degradans (strain 2-40 / ATCC 43961 / DSM 17024) TaxID=203122 RepID=Q21IS7_SACD2|nr:ComEA family DNA-binding protein [Saccharophagus degradans]ABD81402.1 Competence protein ComEA helix-hairpin-helix region [Saccharophagus degradans 2-40]
MSNKKSLVTNVSLIGRFLKAGSAMLAVCAFLAAGQAVAAPKAETEQPAAETQQVVNTVNINKADAEAIATALVGVGKAKAEAIVAYRTQHGEFTSIEQLAEVKGIGEATVAKNKSRLTL